MVNVHKLVSVPFSLLWLLLTAVPAMAANIYVNDLSTSGDSYTTAAGYDTNAGVAGSPFRTIVKALQVSIPGDTIYIDAGNYAETLVIDTELLTLIGADSRVTVIDPPGSRTTGGLVGIKVLNCTNVLIKNIGIVDAYDGIWLTDADSVTITSDSFSGMGNFGIHVKSNYAKITDNMMFNFNNGGYSIQLDSGQNTVSANTIDSTSYGMLISTESNTISRNTVKNSLNIGIYLNVAGAYGNLIETNTTTGNGTWGIYLAGPENRAFGNIVTQNSTGGVYISAAANTVRFNHIKGNTAFGMEIANNSAIVEQNDILSNDTGVFFNTASAGIVLRKNNIYNNNVNNVRNAYSASQTADRNWFGTADSVAIGAKLADVNSDFDPWRLTRVDTAPGSDSTAPKAPDTVAILPPPGPPGPSDTSIILEWTAVTTNEENNGGAVGLGGYGVYRSTVKDTSLWIKVAEVYSGIRYQDTDVVPGQTYFYRIAAFDGSTPVNKSFFSDSQPSDSAVFKSVAVWYVNDTATAGDSFTTAAGADTPSGVGTPPAPFRNIQTALKFATPGDTVFIDAGVYYETVVITADSVALIGKDSVSTVIDPPAGDGIFADTQTGLLIRNLGVTGAVVGIKLEYVSRSTIDGDSVGCNTGIGILFAKNCDNNTVKNNTVFNNTQTGINIEGANIGDGIGSADTNVIENNVVRWNTQYGIAVIYDARNNTVRDNTSSNNTWDGVLLHSHSMRNSVYRNVLENNRNGVNLLLANVHDNYVYANMIRSNQQAGVRFGGAGPDTNVVFGNDITANDTGVWVIDASRNNVVTKNNISGNNVNNVWNQSGIAQTFTRNWWGTADDSSISLKFTDTASAYGPFRLGKADTAVGADTTAPGKPLSVSIDTGTAKQVILTWTIPALNEETNGGAVAFGGVNIWRLKDLVDTSHWANPSNLVKTTAAGDTTWTDTNVTSGATYYYRLTSKDTATPANESFFTDTVFGEVQAYIDNGASVVYVCDAGDSTNVTSADTTRAFTDLKLALKYLNPDNGWDTIVVFASKISDSYASGSSTTLETGLTIISYKSIYGSDTGGGGDTYPQVHVTGVLTLFTGAQNARIEGLTFVGANNLSGTLKGVTGADSMIIRNNTFYSWPRAIQVTGSVTGVVIETNTISNSGSSAFYPIDLNGGDTLTVRGNRLWNAGADFAIYVGGTNVRVEGNTIDSAVGGVKFNGAGGKLVRNTLKTGIKVGVSVAAAMDLFVQNTITGYDSGVQLAATPTAPISKNNIYSNTAKDLDNPSSYSATLTRNWWGTANEGSISAKINDSVNDFRPYRLAAADTAAGADTTAPGKPLNVTLDTSVAGQIKVTWTIPTLNEETSGGAVGFNGVKIYRLKNSVDTTHWANSANLVKTLNSTDTFWKDTDVTDGSTYYYRLTSRDGAAFVNESFFTDTVIASPDTPLLKQVQAAAGLSDAQDGNGCAWADFDNDTDLDIFVVNYSTADILYRYNGNDTFTNVAAGAGVNGSGAGVGVSWGDFNNDGNIDVYVVNNGGGQDYMYRNDGNGAFTDVATTIGMTESNSGDGASWGDYDNDGDLDIYVSNASSQQDLLFRNNDGKNFTSVATSVGMSDAVTGYAVAWADYDKDGDLDLYVTFDGTNQDRLYKNSGHGQFTDVAVSAGMADSTNSNTAAWGDYDADGDLDLFVPDGSQTKNHMLYQNNGSGTFTNAIAGSGITDTGGGGVVWVDYDNDADLDLYMSGSMIDGGIAGDALYRNNANGTFTQEAVHRGITVSSTGYGGAWGDYDNDGDMDLYVTHQSGTKQDFLFRNKGTPGKNWIKVNPLTDKDGDAVESDADTDRLAIGALVEIDIDGGANFDTGFNKYVSLLLTGNGFQQTAAPVHLGVDTATTVAVRVTFPDGDTAVQTGVSTNQTITIRDPQFYPGPVWYVNDTVTTGDSFAYAAGSDLTGKGNRQKPFKTITRALAFAKAGDTVYVDAGLYTETVVIDSDNIALIGKDSNATVIDPPGARTTVGLYGIYADTQSGLLIKNLGVTGAREGIRFDNVDLSTITGDSASSNGDTGIYLFNGSDTNTISNNAADTNYKCGIVLVSSSGNTLTSNSAGANFQQGIYLRSTANGNTLNGNTANSNRLYGIYLSTNSSNNTIKNNTTNSSQLYDGIYLYSGCNNNAIYGHTAKSNGQHGINLYTNSNDNLVRNNVTSSNTLFGIVVGGSSNNTFFQNDIELNAEYQVYFDPPAASSDTFQKNNIRTSAGNPDSGVYNGSTAVTNKFTFTRNYWSSTDTARIKKMFFQLSNGDSIIWQPFRLGKADTAEGADTTAPKAPDTVAVIGAPSDTAILLEWSAVSALEETNGGAAGLSGYRVYRSAVKDTSSWVKVAQTSSGVIRWQDTDIVVGTRYYYRVTAFDTAAPFENESFFSDSQPSDSAVLTTTVNWYVNDGSTAGDSFTYAAGADTTSGKGTPGAPFKSIPRAMQFATAGDTVWIDAGTYDSFVKVSSTETAGVNINVDSLSLIGKDSNATVIDPPGDSSVVGLYGVYADTQIAISVKNIGVLRCRNGVRWVNVDKSTLTGDSVSMSGQHSVYLLNGSDTNTLSGSVVSFGAVDGLYLDGSDGNSLTNNSVGPNGGNGITLFSNANNTVSGNTVNSNSSVGIYLSSSTSNTVSNNTVNSNLSNGIDLANSGSNTLNDNTVNSNSAEGIRLTTASSANNVIRNNTVNSNGSTGILLSSSGSGNVIRNNVIKNNTLAGLQFTASDTNSATLNEISGNDSGVVIATTSRFNTVSKNNLTGNTGNNLRNKGGLAQTNLTRNWLGSADSVTVGGKVTDTINAFTPYRLAAVDTLAGADTTAPKAPDTVAVIGAPSDTAITLEWSAVTANEETAAGGVGLSGYRVYRSAVKDTSSWVKVGQTTSIRYQDTDVTPGTRYYYRVTAFDTASPFENESFFSDSQPSDSAVLTTQVNFYVNDAGTAGDSFTYATGSDAAGKGTASQPFLTITKAMQLATAGDTIIVDAGTYTETVVIGVDSVTLTGKDSAATVIDPPGASGTAGLWGITAISRTGLLIKNLGVTGAYIGIHFNGVTRSTVTGDSVSSCGNAGIYIQNSSGTNTVTGNTVNSNAYGIYLYSGSSNCTVSNNTVKSNSLQGITVDGSAVNNTVSNNTASANGNFGVYLNSNANNNTVSNNTLDSNGHGIHLLSNSSNNTFTGNTVRFSKEQGIYLLTNCTGNTFTNNAVNSGVKHGIYVDASSGNMFAGNDVRNNDSYQIYIIGNSSSDTFVKNNIKTSNANPDSGALNKSNKTVWLQRNWWNTPDSSAIGKMIYDTSALTIFSAWRLGTADTAAGADTTAPKSPDTVAVIGAPSDTAILLEWSAVSALEETNGGAVGLSGYRVYRSTVKDTSSWTQVAQVTSGIRYQDVNVSYGQVYYYRVTSFDTATFENESFFSDSQPFDSAVQSTKVNWYVNDDWTSADSFTYAGGSDTSSGKGTVVNPLRTISRAMQFATAGDTIVVDAGLFAETVVIGVDSISLTGKDSNATVIDPPGSNATAGLYGIYATGRTNLLIKDLGVTGAYNGIRLDNVDLSTIKGDSVGACGNFAVYLLNGSDTNTVNANRVSNNSNYGIHLSSCAGNTVSNNVTNSNASSGIVVFVASNGNTVTGNSSVGNTNYGISFNASSNNTISNNTVSSNTSGGIVIDSGMNNLITGNVASGNPDGGIWMAGGASNNVARNNRVTSGTGAGIGFRLAETSNSNTVMQNDVTGCDTGVWIADSANGYTIAKNNLTGNTTSHIFNKGGLTNTITRNWFGTTDEVTISAKVSDTANAFRPYRLSKVDTASGADTTAPALPTAVTLDTSVAGQITLTWTNPMINEETNGGAVDFGGLNIYRLVNTADTSNWANSANRVKQTTSAATSWTDTNVTAGNTYYYRLTSMDTEALILINESFFMDTRATKPAYAGPVWYVNDTATAGDSFTYQVGGDGGNGDANAPFKTITKALSKAKAGDSIYVDAGLYTETVVIDTDNVKLIGKDSNATVIDPPGSNATAGLYGVYADTQTGLVVKNLAVTGAYDGIRFENVTWSTVSGDSVSSNGSFGIYLLGCSLANNTVSGNQANDNSYGIYLLSSSSNTLSNNNASSNQNYGIYLLTNSDNNTVSGNTANSTNLGIVLGSSHNNVLSNNIANSNPQYGINLSQSSKNRVRHNITKWNTQCGIRLEGNGTDTNVIEQNEISGNDTGINMIDAPNNNTITKNNITGNNVSSVYNPTGKAQTLSRNWWGTSDEVAISNKFKDTVSTFSPYRFAAVDTAAGADTTAPDKPLNVTLDTSVAAQITVTWTIPSLNEETNGGAVGFSGVKIYRLKDAADTNNWANSANLVRTTGSTETTWVDTTASTGGTYYYRLSSFDGAAFVNQSALTDTKAGSWKTSATLRLYEDSGFLDETDTLSTVDVLYIEVRDSDENRNSGAVETVTVTVYAANGVGLPPVGLVLDTETLTLTESGSASGIFRSGAISVSNVFPLVPNDGSLARGLTDTIHVAYKDADDASDVSSDTALALDDPSPSVTRIFEDANFTDEIDTAFARDVLYLQVTDTDENRNPQTTDTVLVTVTVGDDAAGLVIDTEQITLIETSDTSGVFQSGAINTVDTDAIALAGNGRLGVGRSDTVHVSYSDAGTADASYDTVLILGPLVTATAPANAAETNATAIRFEWSGTNVDTYTWQMSRSSSFATIVDSAVDTIATSMIRTITAGQDTFFWRVIGRHATGSTDTSAIRGFLLDTSAPQVNAVAPADGHETTVSSVTVKWLLASDSVGIDSYAVEVSKNAGFTSMILTDTVDRTVSTSTAAGLYNDTYFWRVRAIDDLANFGPYSAVNGFVTDTLVGQVVLSQPADMHETTASAVVLSWTAVADSVGIDSYAVEVSNSASALFFSDTIDGSLTSSTVTGLNNDTYTWRARAIDDLGNGGAFSAVRKFLTDSQVGQVALSSPADGNQTKNGAVVLTWLAVADSTGIDSYVVEVSRSSGFTSTVFADTVDGSGTTDTFNAATNDTFFWRVRAIDDLGQAGANSAMRGFIVDTQAGAPSLSSPAPGAQKTTPAVALTWLAVPDSVGIDSYVVEVSTSSGFTSTVFADTMDGGAATDTFTAGASDTYFWRVRAIDQLGNVSPNSAVIGFLVDTGVAPVVLSSPPNGNQTTNPSVAMAWNAVSDSAGIDSYVVEVSKSSGFTTTLFADTVDGGVTTDTFTASTIDTYFWRVRAIDNLGGVGANSAVRGFLVDSGINQVGPSSPADGYQTKNGAVALTWGAVGDSVGIDSYVVEVSKSSGFSSTVFVDTVDGVVTADTFNAPTNDTYFWRVRAIDHLALVGINSITRGFVVDTQAGQVVLSSPADGNQTTNPSVTFSWAAVADSVGIDSYVVEVSTNSGFTSTIFADTVDGASTTGAFTAGGSDTYFWRVRAIDHLANVGVNSAVRGFMVDTGVAPVALSSPANGNQTPSPIVVLTWSAVSDSAGIDSYALDVSRTSGFAATVFADTVDGAVTTDTFIATDNDTYFWRVRAIDNLGQSGANSPARGFVVDTTVAQVALVSPANGHETTVTTVVLSWSAAPDSVGIDSYALEVSKNTGFTAMAFTDTVDGSITSDSASGLAADSYFWRVRAVDQLGNGGVYSAVRGFLIDSGVAQVTVTSPADGHETTVASVVVAWTAVQDSSGIDSYVVEASTSSGFGSLMFADTVDGVFTSDTITGLANDTYFWRVRAIDNARNVGLNSITRGFVTDSQTGQPSPVSPADAYETTATSLTLTWTAVADSVGLDSYTVEVAKDAGFAFMVINTVIDASATTYSATGLYNDTHYWRVRATDDLGNVGLYSAVRGFLVDTSIGQVTALFPADGSETTVTGMNLSWAALADSVGIDSYAVEASTNASFASLFLADTVDGTQTSRGLSGLFNDTYFWRVRAIDDLANGGAFSAVRGFLMDTIINAPVPSQPSNAHETTNASVVVSWNALADSVGIDSYALDVSKSPAFTSSVFADTVDGMQTSDTVTGLYNDTYYWHVMAMDDLGNVGAYSATRGFLVDTQAGKPTLTSPANNLTTIDSTPAFTWTAVPDSVGIDSYALEVSASPTFGSVAFTDTVDGSVTADTSGILQSATYYWRVRAIDDLANVGPNADSFTLTIDTAAASVTLVAPAAGHETKAGTVTFQWSGVNADTYTWQLSKSSAFGTIVDSLVDSTATSVTRAISENDTYFWRVIARSSSGLTWDTSPARGILLDTAVSQISAVAPDDLMGTTATTVVLAWTSVSDSVGIDSYVVEASNGSGFTSLVFADTVDVAVVTDTRSSLAVNPYYWRVRAIDNLGNIGPNSVTRQFTVNSPYNGPKWYVNDVRSAADSFTYEGGADTNYGEGSPQKPFRTIGLALKKVNVGETIFIDAGIYSETVVIDSNSVSLIGKDSGAAGTVIDPGDSSTSQSALSATGRTGLLVKDLRVQSGFNSLMWTTVTNSRIENVTVRLTGSRGLWLVTNCTGNTLANNLVEKCNSSGITLQNGCDNNTLTGNTSSGNSGNGNIYIQASSNNTLTGNAAIGQAQGFWLNSASNNNTLSNNTVSGSASGVLLDGSNSNTVSGNVIQNNISQAAVRVIASSAGNVIRNNLITGGQSHGVSIVSSGGNLFVQNTFDSNAGYQVHLTGAATDTFFKNNFRTSPTNPDSGVYNSTNKSYDFSRNSWSTSDELKIDRMIYDTAAAKLVTFRPYRLGQVDTAAGADTTAPAAPAGVTLDTSEAGYITVRWTIPSLNEETNGGALGFAGVSVYRLTNSPDTAHWSNALVWKSGASDMSWRDTTVTGQNTYFYRLTSRDGAAFVNESFFTPDTKSATRVLPPQSPADTILIASGNHQLAAAGAALSQAIRVRVVDTGGAGSNGAKVIFRITHGSGAHLGDSNAITTTTAFADASGYVSESLVLGSTPGVYRVEARNDSAPDRAVVFTAYADGREVPDSSWRMLGPNKRLLTSDPAALTHADFGAGVRIFEYREDIGVNSVANSTRFHPPTAIQQGRGYWMKPGNPGAQRWVIDEGTQGVAGFDTVKVTLTNAGGGWNQIASGQYFYVDWQKSVKIDTGFPGGDTWVGRIDTMLSIDSAHAAGILSKILYWYDGSQYLWGPNTLTSNTGTIVSTSSTASAVQMKPMVGFWVKASQACTMYIFPNPAEIGPTDTVNLNQAPRYLSAAYGNTPGSEKDWTVQLIVTAGGKSDPYNYFGVRSDAAAARQSAVFEPPPAAGGNVSLAIRPSPQPSPQRGEGDDGATWMAASFAEPDPEGRTWEVAISSDLSGATTLTWDNVSNLPQNYEAYLIGGPSGPVNLRQSSSLVLESKIENLKSKIPLTLAVGLSDYLAAFLAGTLDKTQTFIYPNPGPDAAGNMTFKYNLAAPADVTIKIYDVGGKLARDLRFTGAAGSNTAIWDTTNKHGQKLGSGVYIYILESGGVKLVDKLAIVR